MWGITGNCCICALPLRRPDINVKNLRITSRPEKDPALEEEKV